MLGVPEQCGRCKWFEGDSIGSCTTEEEYHVCPAFPKGIPWNIALGSRKHDRILAEQEGDYIFVKD